MCVFGPLTGRLWGIIWARTGRDEGEGGTSRCCALEGSTRCCLIENHAALSLMTMHGWTAGGWNSAAARTLMRGGVGEKSHMLHGIRAVAAKQSPLLSFTNNASLFTRYFCGDRWGRRVVIHNATAGQYGSPYLPSVGDCFILSLIGIRHRRPVRIYPYLSMTTN